MGHCVSAVPFNRFSCSLGPDVLLKVHLCALQSVTGVRLLPVPMRYECLCSACIIQMLITWLCGVLAFYLGLFRICWEGGDERREGKRVSAREGVSSLLTCHRDPPPLPRVPCSLPQVAGSHLLIPTPF